MWFIHKTCHVHLRQVIEPLVDCRMALDVDILHNMIVSLRHAYVLVQTPNLHFRTGVYQVSPIHVHGKYQLLL